jgi:thiamine-phosphate pyrophosphorylase
MTARPADQATPERLRRREILRGCPVYLVTEEAFSAGRSSADIAEAALAAGVRVIQIREKESTARRAFEIALEVRTLAKRYGALVIVNDRVDLAIAAGVDGVHLGQQDLPIGIARRLLGDDALIGLSITEASQLDGPEVQAADYLGVGAVFPTGTKADAAVPGLALLGEARAATSAPIVAIGGIGPENAALPIVAGADSLAVITAITQAADPQAAVRELAAAAQAARASLPAWAPPPRGSRK